MTKLPSVAQVYGLPTAPGQIVTLRSTVRTADGIALTPIDLFDLGAGGLRLVDDDPLHQVARVEDAGTYGAACAAAHVPSPCLAPKIDALAHTHLLTPEELARTLVGEVEIDAVVVHPTIVAPSPLEVDAIPWPVVACGGVLAAIAIAVGVRAFVRGRPLAHVLGAARAARKATRKDATLADVRSKIDDLVLYARLADRVRRDCAARHARIDRDALAAGLPAEREEAGRLERDLARAKGDLSRVASALRLVTMQAREGRARATTPDPVAELTAELAMRDEAFAELHASE